MAVTGFTSHTKVRSGFDPAYASAQLDALRELFSALGAEQFYRSFISILRKKDESGVLELKEARNRRLVPYCLNRMQRDMRDKFTKRNITLKERQGGSTTHHIIDRLYVPTILNPGTNALLISQTRGYAIKHLAILKRANKHFGRANPFFADLDEEMADLHAHLLHTQYSPRHEIVFDFLDATIAVESSENEEAGQGVTTHRALASEYSRWVGHPEETMANMKEAIVQDGTLDIECTANGAGENAFFKEWVRAQEWPKSEYRPHFYEWWWCEEYEENTSITEEELTEEERTLAQKVGLTLRQIQFRRNKQLQLRHNFPEKYPEDEHTCFLISGRCFFDTTVLRELNLARMNERPLEIHGNGDYIVYKRRIPGRRYIIGADAAEGRFISEGNPDRNAAVVCDLDTGEEMASYSSRLPPEDYAHELSSIGAEYNNAVIAVERNGPGGSVILTLEREILYPNVYYFPDRLFLKEKQTGKRQVIRMAGFPTTDKTRRHALNELAKLLRDGPELWHSHHFIEEALFFCYNEKGKPEALPGQHDDSVSARWCMAGARSELLGYWDPTHTGLEAYGDTGEGDEPA